MEDLLPEVIDTVSVREREVQDKDGRWYFLRVRPYMTLDNKVDGAVLVLVDINDLKRSEREAKAARDYAEAIIRTTRDPLWSCTPTCACTPPTKRSTTFKTSPDQTEGRLIYELGNQQWDIPKLRKLLEEILPRNSFFNDFEVTHDFPQIGRRTMLLNARRLEQDDGAPQMILLAIEDITERQRAEAAHARLAAIVVPRTTPSSAKISTASSPVGTKARSGCSATRRRKPSAGPLRCSFRRTVCRKSLKFLSGSGAVNRWTISKPSASRKNRSRWKYR